MQISWDIPYNKLQPNSLYREPSINHKAELALARSVIGWSWINSALEIDWRIRKDQISTKF